MPGPLHGVRIIDLTAVVLGPVATLHLADMGADVIKVEPPEGDVMRNPGNAPNPSMGPIYLGDQPQQALACLDLKKPEAMARPEAADRARPTCFVHNMRVEAIERLGLGYEAVRAIKPDIVYAYSVGYKHFGPYGQKPAFDDLVQGASGAAMLASRVDGGAPRFLPSLIVDKTTGLHLGMAVLGALLHRERTGEGQMVEVPMLETITGFWLAEHLFEHTYVPPRGAHGISARAVGRSPALCDRATAMSAPSSTTRSTGGHSPTRSGGADLLTDPRFANADGSLQQPGRDQALMAEVMPTRTTAEWLAFFDKADIPAMAVNDLEDSFDDPHLAADRAFSRRASIRPKGRSARWRARSSSRRHRRRSSDTRRCSARTGARCSQRLG